VDARIRVSGGDLPEELASLWEWLRDTDELRGDVSLVERPIGETDLGGVFDLLAVVLSSSGAGMALSRSLTTWLQSRRSDVKVTVSSGDRTIEFDGTNLKEVLPALREVLSSNDEG